MNVFIDGYTKADKLEKSTQPEKVNYVQALRIRRQKTVQVIKMYLKKKCIFCLNLFTFSYLFVTNYVF